MKAIIVGGGIAGLASALALTRRGWQAEVLERAPEFTEVGTGLSLWSNALRALDALGVGEPVRSRATLAGQAGIRDAAGRWLSRSDTAELERRYGPAAMIHRADLLAVLLAAVPDQALRPGITVHASNILVKLGVASCGDPGATAGGGAREHPIRSAQWQETAGRR